MTFKHFSEMVWVDPNTERISELERRLRYSGLLTSEDYMLAATVISNYRDMVNKTQKDRNFICKMLNLSKKS